MTPEIWGDIRIRMRNLRADIIGQWQGDLDNVAVGNTVQMLQNAERVWQSAKPVEVPAPGPNVVESR